MKPDSNQYMRDISVDMNEFVFSFLGRLERRTFSNLLLLLQAGAFGALKSITCLNDFLLKV